MANEQRAFGINFAFKSTIHSNVSVVGNRSPAFNSFSKKRDDFVGFFSPNRALCAFGGPIHGSSLGMIIFRYGWFSCYPHDVFSQPFIQRYKIGVDSCAISRPKVKRVFWALFRHILIGGWWI